MATAATVRCPTTRSCSSRCARWRKEQAEAQSVPAFVVFSDATLEALAEVKPTDRSGLQSINGIGAAKLEKYAEDLLAILG